MSFGEHLEELRVALWKAIQALVIGFLIGLLLGGEMVKFVQKPLNEGLERLLTKQKQERYEASLPEGAEPDEGAIAEGLVPESYLVDPRELIGVLEGHGVTVDGAGQELPERAPLTLWRPIEDEPGVRTIGTGVPDAFTVYVKASLVIGTILSSPFIFYFLWSFVAVGLYRHEKKYVHVFLPFSIGLFLLGAALAFFVVFRFVLAFLFQFYDWMDIDPTPRISEWLGFVLILPIGFGLAFQLPLVMLFLERIGVISVTGYLRYWRYAVLVIFILSMILTPADPQSMILMALPLTMLYFGGVLLCKYLPRSSLAPPSAMTEGREVNPDDA